MIEILFSAALTAMSELSSKVATDKERERCARIAEEVGKEPRCPSESAMAKDIAAKIRQVQ